MATPKEIQEEIDRNYEAFRALLPDLIQTDAGKWVLLRNGEVELTFDTSLDAQRAGEKFYEDGFFSVQHVTERPIDLGWFSHAVPQRNV